MRCLPFRTWRCGAPQPEARRRGEPTIISARTATRLFPAAAFEEIGADLLRMAQGTPRVGGAIIPVADFEAVVYLRVPQFPSSRSWGTFPVVTVDEYQARMPARRADRQIIQVPARPFPPQLRDPDLLPLIVGRWEMRIAAALWSAAPSSCIAGCFIGCARRFAQSSLPPPRRRACYRLVFCRAIYAVPRCASRSPGTTHPLR